MALTLAQRQTLKADIAADPALASVPHTADGAYDIAGIYNLDAVPSYYVWKVGIETAEVMGIGFDWTRVDNLTIGKARIWEWMVLRGAIDPSDPNVRAGILQVFATAGDLATRLAIFQRCQKLATRAEKLFAVGTGTATTEQGAGPSKMGFSGLLVYQDVLDAWNS